MMGHRFVSLLFATILYAKLLSASPINATYDQRQNGKVNVHISIKDVAIILQGDAMGGSDGDDINYNDYDYDYDHLTVKPNGIWATLGQTSTSAAPSNAPPTPAAPQSPGFLGVGSPGNFTFPLQIPVVVLSQNTTKEETETADNSPLKPEGFLIQYPIPEDYTTKPAEAPLETINNESHPFPENLTNSEGHPESSSSAVHPITKSSIIKITSKRPQNGGSRTTPKYAWNGDLEDVEVIIEPVLKNKQRPHVVPGADNTGPRTRGNFRKFGRHRNNDGKATNNKFGMEQLIKLLSVLDKDDGKDYTKEQN